MNIEPKLTADQVFAVAKLLEQVYETYPSSNPDQKLVRSISFDLADKFTTKQRTVYKSNSLFDTKKKYKMTLKYHEAFTLYAIVQYFLPMIPKEEKAHNDLLKLSTYLHPKLI